MANNITPDEIYSFISTITKSAGSKYDAAKVAQTCSSIIQDHLSLNMDRSRNSIALVGDLVYHEFLSEETSLLHPLFRHHCQVADLLVSLINPDKLFINDTFFIMDLISNKYNNKTIHYLNHIELHYMEEFRGELVDENNVISFSSIDSDSFDYDYDLIMINIYRLFDFRIIEKLYSHTNAGGSLIFTSSHQQGLMYKQGWSNILSHIHERLKSLPNSSVFHISEGIGYTVVKKEH